jgi:hypothetical protein
VAASPRHAALGLTAAALGPALAAARAADTVWRSPLGAPVRRPATAVYDAAAHRGALIELRLRAIARDEIEYRLGVAVQDPRFEELVDRILTSHLITVVAERVRTNEEMLRTVEAIAASDAVRSALTSQSTGLVREVADEVRDRTAGVDDAMDNVVRRLLGRRRREPGSATVTIP